MLCEADTHDAMLHDLKMAGALKRTTGLVGLAVESRPHEKLKILYGKCLAALQALPQTCAYRQNTETIVNERLNLVKTTSNVTELENKIGSGQVEEVILQADAELQLARKMAEWQPWEPLVGEAPAGQWEWP
ncbi:NADH dehydrogenase [ubiquinone] 1 alpha subcomplex subunit 5-like [Ptychodera flava]|uniref:NADH dehydrogenase [ubiquinone] 1 alpha subcomplex subunit 5-like n=1 Tax=Ptychodera flava TaxID=63121 RepID=UPI00396A3BD7